MISKFAFKLVNLYRYDEAFDKLRSAYSVKIVVYVEGLAAIPAESLEPFRERCDDFIEAPARGVMVGLYQAECS